MGAAWSLETPAGVPGAIGCVAVWADSEAELEALLSRAVGRSPCVGAVVLTDLLGVDRGLVARWSPTRAQLMPHGGTAIVRTIIARLGMLGLEPDDGVVTPARALEVYPEGRTAAGAMALATIARAQSPAAVGVLLDHAARIDEGRGPVSASTAAALARLIVPPLVVAMGAANIGKSTLLNALSGRRVAAVADEPGTTRDHVGVMLRLDESLVVRYVDTPGRREGAPEMERDAMEAALALAARADLLLLLGDPSARAEVPVGLEAIAEGLGKDGRVLRACLRADVLEKGGAPAWDADVRVSVVGGFGVADLAGRMSRALVPPSAWADPGAWRFWG